MKTVRITLVSAFLLMASCLTACAQQKSSDSKSEDKKMTYKVQKTEEEWKKELSAEQYTVLRQKGTERPFTGKYENFYEKGSYHCAACGAKLFESGTKFDSHCGWPSFDKAIPGTIEYHKDVSFGMIRTEVTCANCGGHLGHVFDDGPTATGDRYCINSVSLKFEPDTEVKK
ncbi:peptide-methionine (R)-S-oxide reductase MsrB [Solitalea sp. MAHUQ-68]|uniref:peptide-methionine (R)-S-oxide reductase n=2 Tax=Solitalea TaxID=929509 RepID=A0A9X2F3J9_9SPHI|nr:peptide-methionine (R)-S-oxide reductase MsrB [Solitalea agri]MCO4293525.1 peptide-methionine (R)-S-oxide reductase MsrB [Solitalea agri]